MTTPDPNLASHFEGCLATSARRLDRVIMALFDDAFRPLGLKSTQVTLLVFIAALGAPRPADLTGPMQIDASTLSRNLDRLESLGYIRSADAEDARTKRLALTREGRAVLRKAQPIWDRCQARARDLLTPAFADQLARRASTLQPA